MADVYKISIEDAATPNAYRIAQAYVEVSIAAQGMRDAVKSGDKELIKSAAAMSQAAALNLRVSRAANTAGAALAKLGPKMPTKPMAEATAQGFKFSYILNSLANQAVNLGFALIRNLASGLTSVASGLYDVADLATRAHMSFANFFGGQASGDKMLRESIEIAKRYGFTIEDTVAQIQRFGAAGFDQKQSKGLLEFGADMMAAGRSVQDVKGIFLAMTQIQGKGKLQAEELTQQLAERGINAGKVWQILSGKLFGGDQTKIKEVMALQKAGQIKAGMALNAIVQAGVEGVHGTKLGSAGAGVADKTIGGLGRRMGTLWEDAIFEAVDKANPALVKGMQSLFGGANAASTSGLQDNLTTMLEGVGNFMEKVGPKIPAMVDGFTKAFGAAAGFKADSWSAFAESLPEAARNLGAIAGAFAKIAAIASTLVTGTADTGHGGFWEFMTTPMNKQGKFWNDKMSGNGSGSGLVSEQSQFNMAVDAKNRSAGDDAIATDVGKNIADGMAAGILSGAPSVAKAAQTVGTGAIDASKDTLGVHSPSTKFRSQGESIVDGLVLGMDQNAELAMYSASMMTDGVLAASAGASGLDSRRAVAAGSAAGAAVSSRSSTAKVSIGDVYIGGGPGGSGGAGVPVDREYFELEFVSMLERHLEGVGA